MGAAHQADRVDTVIKGGQRRRHGSGRTLTLVREEQLRLNIVASNPAQLHLEFALWILRRAVMLAIKQRFGIDVPIRTAVEYLRRRGFTPQRPLGRALEQDPAPLRAWLKDEYPKIVARTNTEDAEIYWGDETAMRQDSNWARSYSMAGLTREFRLSAGRQRSTSMISAITNRGLVRFSFFEDVIGAERFIVFLKHLIQHARRKVFLIVDNLRVHRANRVCEWVAEDAKKVAEDAKKIQLFYLAPYAPELDTEEYQNRDLKTTVRSGPITKTAAALLEEPRTRMERIAAMLDRVMPYLSREYARHTQ